MSVKFDSAKPGRAATVWRIAGSDPAAHNTADKKDIAIVEEKDVPFGERLTVPAFSVNLYRVAIE